MPLKLTVNVARKVGQPHYGSLGAACGLELELPEALPEADPDGFRRRVRAAYDACDRAVDDELARLAATPTGEESRPRHRPDDGAPTTTASRPRPRRPATPSQARALRAIARVQDSDLEAWLRTEHGVDRPEDLSAAEAGRLIDALQATAGV
jgi:hypothetical protein